MPIRKNCNQGYCKSLNKDIQGFTHQLTVLTSYLPVFMHKSTECSKQELTHLKFPCKICAKNVSEKFKAVHCDLCEIWVHIKCNNLNYLDYRYLQKKSNESWYCIECCSTIFHFNSLSSNKNFLVCCANTDNNTIHWRYNMLVIAHYH